MKKKSFTLVEIMIVIAIIAILAAIAVPSISKNRETGWRTSMVGAATTCKTAVANYMASDPNVAPAAVTFPNILPYLDPQKVPNGVVGDLTIGSKTATWVNGKLLFDGNDPLTSAGLAAITW